LYLLKCGIEIRERERASVCASSTHVKWERCVHTTLCVHATHHTPNHSTFASLEFDHYPPSSVRLLPASARMLECMYPSIRLPRLQAHVSHQRYPLSRVSLSRSLSLSLSPPPSSSLPFIFNAPSATHTGWPDLENSLKVREPGRAMPCDVMLVV
jgi:hypothetical protein